MKDSVAQLRGSTWGVLTPIHLVVPGLYERSCIHLCLTSRETVPPGRAVVTTFTGASLPGSNGGLPAVRGREGGSLIT